MKFVAISDTHDNMQAIRDLIDALKSERFDFIVHAGDIVAPFAMKALKNLGKKIYFAFGNNDGEKRLLTKIAEDNEWVIGEIVEFPEGVVYHGTDARIVEILKKTNHRYLVLGHTHEVKVERVENKIIINPGEICGYLTGRRTFAIVEDGVVSVVEF
ncbi:metallophosphoesterase [Archaeoglobus profundus]|uniref:Phosphoesterase n=1 Tax=Archaeoglobus profundus (strain DSM 5631 / JCM 9629 / NBRC 100127 / Av18) TaxID=572546 RepID=D2RGL1_ARCPA|nr:metallophosphoesterase [Archaeoglobus profundus]ADB57436.1 phosphodiesterase, MJ0936 family [Archaeoglobus profundus DSM 5631]